MREMTTTTLLGVLILLVGAIKIPSPAAGCEFQLSAPLAVLICVYFGFKRYMFAGILASLLGLLLGTANLFNIIIALVFRLVVGLLVTVSKGNLPIIVISGPLGTMAARFVIAQLMHISWLYLAAAAIPGMIFTAVAVALAYKPGLKLKQKYVK